MKLDLLLQNLREKFPDVPFVFKRYDRYFVDEHGLDFAKFSIKATIGVITYQIDLKNTLEDNITGLKYPEIGSSKIQHIKMYIETLLKLENL